MNSLLEAAAYGYSVLAAWTDLIDRINVFPVADGDTGTNLRISLAPLQDRRLSHVDMPRRLARAAVGNSGNIAAAFFCEFLRAKNPRHLAARARAGHAGARQAVLDPCAGTMLDVFTALAGILEDDPLTAVEFLPLCGQLQNAVLATTEQLPRLQEAGVVDAGALAMFIFFQGFFKSFTSFPGEPAAISRLFGNKLSPADNWQPQPISGHCVDVLLSPDGDDPAVTDFGELGSSVVISKQEKGFKIHLHTDNPAQLRNQLCRRGRLLHWKSEDMAAQTLPQSTCAGGVHILTDAAGSLDRQTARKNGITLLDSYIIATDSSMPESLCQRQTVYRLLREKQQVSTAQASLLERHNQYASALEQFEQVIYLCTGSAYTGNFATASAWKEKHDHDNRFTVIDTGAASGRLALIALRTAEYTLQQKDGIKVLHFAGQQCNVCWEYLFIDCLQYLVAGGRVGRTRGFMGDLLHLKPIISPMPAGVKKQGVVRTRQDQLKFARKHLAAETAAGCEVLLQYSDNKQWVTEVASPALKEVLPEAEIMVVPLSLTSGVHMGPGTWGVAFAGRET
jgi:DegV family protein with EDD domain